MTPDVIFIGAGVAGLGAAWLLAEKGVRVLVLERDEPGAGTSGRAGGMLAPSAELKFGEEELLKFELESMRLWPDFVAHLEARSQMKVDYRTHGTLIVAVDRDDLERIDHLWTYHRELELEVQRMDGDALRELEPSLAPGIPGGLYVPGDHQVDPRLLVQALVEAIRNAGGEVRENARVLAVETQGGAVSGVQLEDEFISAPSVVVSAGVWLKEIEGLPKDDRPRVRPVRGQMIAVECGEPPLLKHVVRGPDAYLIPRSDGELVIGSTMEEQGFDPALTAGGLMDILVGAWEVLPGIHQARVLGTWTGFRPMTLDNMPQVRASSVPGLFWSVGHGRNGILLTPATAERLVFTYEKSSLAKI